MSKPWRTSLARASSTLALALVFLQPWPASAAEDEITLGLGPSYQDLRNNPEGQPGFGGTLYAGYHLTDFWGLTAGVMTGYHLSDGENELPGSTVGFAWLGVRYNIDVTTWVPYGSLAVTGYAADPSLTTTEGDTATAGLKLALGIDYRRFREWSVGLEGNLHGFYGDLANYPTLVTINARLNYHFEL